VKLSVLVGLFLALATAVTAVVANLMRHKGAHASAPVDFRHPISTSLALFRSRWYLAGILVANVSWAFHVGALALAPISLAQSVIAGGLALLAVTADRVFHLEVTRREWVGVAMAAVGLALLAATVGGTAKSAHSAAATSTVLAYVGVTASVGAIIATAARRMPAGGPILGLATGALWGSSDVTIKAVTGRFDDGTLPALLSPLVAVVITLSLVSLVVSARSLQLGPPVAVIAMTAAAGNIVTILSGFVVFHEPLPSGSVGITLRIAALTLVIVAAALTPPRAEGIT
jgi:drug/metabolite transporter (DMT)-like permease